MHALIKNSRVVTRKMKAVLMLSIVFAGPWLVGSINALAQDAPLRNAIGAIDYGVASLVQLQPQLKPKPGYIIGRILDSRGRPLLPIEIHVQGFRADYVGNPLEYYHNFEPFIDPRTGYYEIQVPNGAYRVTPRFRKQIRDSTSEYTCLLVFEDFVSGDGRRYEEQPYSESRRGIVRDFIWHPEPSFARQCSLFRR